ncbi:MAG: ABC transporter permease [Sporolactobacillus sp.]
MTLFDLASRHMKRNFYQYLLYFASMNFSVLIFFTFVSIQYNAQVDRAVSMQIDAAFKAGAVVLILFAAVFIGYSNSFFTRRRKKEIGLYALLGLQKKQIAQMLFYENLILGVLSLVFGILIGTLFSKFFTMLLMKLMDTVVSIHFMIASQAVIETLIVFMSIILLSSLYDYALIYRFHLVDLFRAEKQGDRMPKSHPLTGLLAICLIIAGYAISLTPLRHAQIWGRGEAGLLRCTMVILFCTIFGSYLFFCSTTVFFLQHCRKRRHFYFRGTNLISISQLSFHIRGNARVLTIITTLSAVTLCSVGASFGAYYRCEQLARSLSPYSYSYLLKGKDTGKAEALFLRQVKDQKKHRLITREELPIVTFHVRTTSPLGKIPITFLSESSANRLLHMQAKTESFHLNRHQGVIVDPDYQPKSSALTVGQSVNDGAIKIKMESDQTFQLINTMAIQSLETIVISDSQFTQIERNHKPSTLGELMFTNDRDSGRFIHRLNRSLSHSSSFVNASSFYEIYHSRMISNGLILFLGLFIGLVFLLATGSVLYFKQMNELEQEKKQYAILKKLGISKREMNSSLSSQVGFIFALPLVVGICHSIIALAALSKVLDENITIPVIICMAAYASIYLAYSIYTTYACAKAVSA